MLKYKRSVNLTSSAPIVFISNILYSVYNISILCCIFNQISEKQALLLSFSEAGNEVPMLTKVQLIPLINETVDVILDGSF